MKNIIKLMLVAAIVSIAASSFAARLRPAREVIVTGGAPTNSVADQRGTNVPPPLTNAAPMAARLAQMYAAIVPYDLNADAQLDATEQTALAAAIAGGAFVMPQPTNAPAGTNCAPPTPTIDMSTNIAARLAIEYAVIAPFDVNHDGTLDVTEQAALADAIVAGTVTLPMPPRRAH